MTPKEKADQLYRYYIDYTQGYYNCKECCLTTVTEIINAIAFDFENPSENTIYWLRVKQEVEKL